MEYKTVSRRLVECESALEMAKDDYVSAEIYMFIESVRDSLLFEFLDHVLQALHSKDIELKHRVLEDVRDYICDTMRLGEDDE